MKFEMSFSRLLFYARQRHGYTQAQVAEAVSISMRWYQKLESGAHMPSAKTAIRLILFLQIDIQEMREEAGLIVPVRTVRRDVIRK